MDDVVFLPALLAERAKLAHNRPKRTRTRLALIAAIAAELEENGYEKLTIDSIVKRAGLARGTFYLYYANKVEAVIAVRRSFNAVVRMTRPRRGGRLSPWQSLYRMNRFFVSYYARNARLTAGSEALFRERPDLLKSRDHINHRWAGIMLRDLNRRNGIENRTAKEQTQQLLLLRFVILLSDEALRTAYIDPPPKFKTLLTSENEVAEVLTQIWYRCLYASDPINKS